MPAPRPLHPRRRVALLLLAGCGLGAVSGAVVSAVQPPLYTAQAVLRVSEVRGGVPTVSGPLSRAYAAAAASDAVLRPAVRRIGTDRPFAELKGGTRATAVDSGLIQIEVTSIGRGTAPALANSIVRQMVAVVPAEAAAVAGERTVRAEAALAAPRPTGPDEAPVGLHLLVGALVGLLAGALAAVLLAPSGPLRSRRLRSAQAVARLTDRPLLGPAPEAGPSGAQPDAVALGARSGLLLPAVERWLAAGRSQVVLVTSTRRQEGRTSLVAALGAALAGGGGGRQVLVVDMDLQRPALAQAFGMHPARGVAEVLRGTAALQDVAEVHGSGCVVVPAGQDVDVDAVAGAGAVEEMFRRFRAEVDTVLVDGPPFDGSEGSPPLPRVADCALVVVTLGRTRDTELTALLARLDESGVTSIGIVLQDGVRPPAPNRPTARLPRAAGPANRAPRSARAPLRPVEVPATRP